MSQMLLKSPDIIASTDAGELRRIIEENLKDMPALPVVVAKILQAAASPEASARSLEALIALDAGLTARILRLANSAYYGRSRRIATLAEAVLVLGFNTVRNLTLSASMLDFLAPRGAAQVFDWRAYWEHCTAVAACARLLARHRGLPGTVAEEAFVAGLLHDIGKLFLGKYCPDLLAEVVLTAETFQVPMEEAEWRLMGTNHALLGQEIAEKWNFPASLAGAIGAHHQPEAWRDDPTLTYLVHAANVLTQWAGIGAVDPAVQRLHREVDAWLSLTTVEREDLLAALAAEREKTDALLKWEDDPATNAPPAAALPGESEGIVPAAALAIASANTEARIQTLLREGAEALLPIWGSVLFLWDDAANRFALGAGQEAGVLGKIGEQQIRESLLEPALTSRTGCLTPVAAPRALQTLAEGHRFLVCPLVGAQETLGFLLLGQSAQNESPAPEAGQAAALATLAAHAAAGMSRIRSLRAAVTALSAAIDARDADAGGHANRVRDLAVACARRLGLSASRIETLEVAALLHDVGKLSVPDQILNQGRRLNPEEFTNVAAHAAAGAHLVGPAFGEAMPFILCHHERWDGSGYPEGLRGDQIPGEAQIIAVCETWDAMRTGQPYRTALSIEAAREELHKSRGTQFDPAVVDALLACLPAA